MKRIMRLNPVTSLAPLIGDGNLVAMNVGPDGLVYMVVALKPIDYRHETTEGACFAKTKPQSPQTYRVLALSGSKPIFDLVIEGEQFNIHDIQPLKEDLLLVCGRSQYRSPTNFEKNGRIYSKSGRFIREILLGDGIQNVQTTAQGEIWVSFFDEGVFGNFGWENPVGASGLVAWDSKGGKLFEFQPAQGLDPICDCYAMNVPSDEDVWIYYYTEFPLVHLRNRKVKSVWQMPVSGSSAFAVDEKHVLFFGGYKDRNLIHLYRLLSDKNPELLASFEIRDEAGRNFTVQKIAARGDSIFVVHDNSLYCLDLTTVRAFGNEGH